MGRPKRRPSKLLSIPIFVALGVVLLYLWSVSSLGPAAARFGQRAPRLVSAVSSLASARGFTPRKLREERENTASDASEVAFEPSNSTLIVVTTCNRDDLVRRFLTTAPKHPSYHYLVVSDSRTNETFDSFGARHYVHPAPRGLTASWNYGYSVFKEEGYRHLIITNDDVVVPQESLRRFVDALQQHGHAFHVLGPITTPAGLGGGGSSTFAAQKVGSVWPGIAPPFHAHQIQPTEAGDVEAAVLAYLQVKGEGYVAPVPAPHGHLLGFFLGFSRSIIDLKAQNDPRPHGEFIEPRTVNLYQEIYLQTEVKARFGIATRAFVYHEKAATVSDHPGVNRDDLTLCQRSAAHPQLTEPEHVPTEPQRPIESDSF